MEPLGLVQGEGARSPPASSPLAVCGDNGPGQWGRGGALRPLSTAFLGKVLPNFHLV